MRIAISNIAWDPSEDDAISQVLARNQVDAIDVAPSKYFPEIEATPRSMVVETRDWWASRGIEITGMQALLFGTSGLNLFAAQASREAMLARLGAVCRVGGWLGARRLVFGSPKNRDRAGLPDEHAMALAVPFFRRLGDVAMSEGVCVCLEPNPPRYSCNFMTTTAEAARVVRQVDHAAIRLHVDTGTIAINSEDPGMAVRDNADIIGHVHASEPDLVPLGDGGAPHARVAQALRAALPQAIVSIEMVATTGESHLASVERALRVARRAYGDGMPGPGALR
jgi:sugar phosphate isomerase/epimerase